MQRGQQRSSTDNIQAKCEALKRIYYVCSMYVCIENILHAKSRGLSRAGPEPSRERRLWLGPALEKAGARLGRAKARAFRPSRAGTSLHPPPTSNVMSAQAAESRIMGLKGALERRRNNALTPYKVEAWESMLRHCNLSAKYPSLVHSLHTLLAQDFFNYSKI